MEFEPITRFADQRLRPLGHADLKLNPTNYGVIVLNMFKEKILFRQSRKRVFWRLLIVSC